MVRVNYRLSQNPKNDVGYYVIRKINNTEHVLGAAFYENTNLLVAAGQFQHAAPTDFPFHPSNTLLAIRKRILTASVALSAVIRSLSSFVYYTGPKTISVGVTVPLF